MTVDVVDQPEIRITGIRHLGPYYEIGKAFGSLGGLLKGPPPTGSAMIAVFHDDPDSGFTSATTSYELYLNNPMTTEKPDLLTEIYLRVG